jgi:RNA-binding protein YhbY
MKTITKFQIGKFGVTEGVLDSLELALKHHKQVRISILQAAGRARDLPNKLGEEILLKLKEKNISCEFKTIGFTIILIKRTGINKQV